MNEFNVKVNNRDICIPKKLLDAIIKETDIPKVIIEEGESELYYPTLSGNGKVLFKNNIKFEGKLKYGNLNANEEKNICQITFPDQTIYKGEIKSNQINGNGSYFFPTGSV
jgi:hypothetical protein